MSETPNAKETTMTRTIQSTLGKPDNLQYLCRRTGTTVRFRGSEFEAWTELPVVEIVQRLQVTELQSFDGICEVEGEYFYTDGAAGGNEYAEAAWTMPNGETWHQSFPLTLHDSVSNFWLRQRNWLLKLAAKPEPFSRSSAMDTGAIHHLAATLDAAQRLHKKLRNVANKGEATARDVDDAAQIVAILRAMHARHGLKSLDLDSRGERAKRKGHES
jgi:hypothetical protein